MSLLSKHPYESGFRIFRSPRIFNFLVMQEDLQGDGVFHLVIALFWRSLGYTVNFRFDPAIHKEYRWQLFGP